MKKNQIELSSNVNRQRAQRVNIVKKYVDSI